MSEDQRGEGHHDAPGQADDPQDTQKSYYTILEQEIEEGLEELERPAKPLFLSALSAGLDIGFSALFVLLMISLAEGQLPTPVFELLKANAYSVGFILVIFGRSELFTEHTSLAVLPVLDGKASLLQLGRLWGVVYVANQIGAALFAGLLSVIGPALGFIEPAAMGELGREITGHASWVMVLSAILAGWMMGLVSWLVTAGRETISQIFFVWLVTSGIGLAHLHHCVVGSAEVLPAVILGLGVSFGDYARFLGLATLGNIVGGVIFVALIKYGHARCRTRYARRRDWNG
jgi:formate-nitrite transporter family protein